MIMTEPALTVDGRLSPDGRYVVISPEIRLRVDPDFYREQGFGELGMMPKDMRFFKANPGIADVVTEDLGVERFGSLTMQSREGVLGSVDFRFVCELNRKENRYLLRRGGYKREELLALYFVRDTPILAGLAGLNFEETYIAKLMGLGIKDELQQGGHGTAFLSAIERVCTEGNIFLVLHNPLRQSIPFYVSRGYRYLEHPNGPDFAKVLNPQFDERLLMPRT